MEEWALRGMRRWPNVPALFGWLRLDRRGRWLIRNGLISRPQIIDTINTNYEADAHGRWFFQNGPQRGYVLLDYAPLVLHVRDDALCTHTGHRVGQPSRVLLDEHGDLTVVTEHGPGLLRDTDLPWALDRLHNDGRPIGEHDLERALALPSGERTGLALLLQSRDFAVERLDTQVLPGTLGFVRDPQPLAGERVSVRIAD